MSNEEHAPKPAASESLLGGLSSEGTVIAPAPAELRSALGTEREPSRPESLAPRAPSSASRIESPPAAAGSRPSRGGLGPLFAKSTPPRPPLSHHPASEKTRVVPASSASDSDDEDRPTRVPELTRARKQGSSAPAAPTPQRPSLAPELTAVASAADVDADANANDAEPTRVGRAMPSRTETLFHVPPEARVHSPDAPTVSLRDLDLTERVIPGAAALFEAREEKRSVLNVRGATTTDDSKTAAGWGSPSELESSADARSPEPPPIGHDDLTRVPGAVTLDSETMVAARARARGAAPALTGAEARNQAEHAERLGENEHVAPRARPGAPQTDAPQTDALKTLVHISPSSQPHPQDEAQITALRERAAWLEEEARALDDVTARARALLGVSELLALAGDGKSALALAVEARDLAPEHVALAWSQARHLTPRDDLALVEALDAESARLPTPAARAHATLMAADVLRTSGRFDAAVEHWARACKLDPADVRAPAARAALALASGNLTGAGADLAENSELFVLDKAVATALKLRGALGHRGANVASTLLSDALRRARTALRDHDCVNAATAFADLFAPSEEKFTVLQRASLWLASAFGAAHVAGLRTSAKALRKLIADDGDALAMRQLAARGLALGDRALVALALSASDSASDGARDNAHAAAFEPAEKALLLTWAENTDGGSANETHAAAARARASLGDDSRVLPLRDALEAASPPRPNDASHDSGDSLDGNLARRTLDLRAGILRPGADARTHHDDNGWNDAWTLAGLGRLLAWQPPLATLDSALARVVDKRQPSVLAVALDVAIRAKRWSIVRDALADIATEFANEPILSIASAMFAERAGDRDGIATAYRKALEHHDLAPRLREAFARGLARALPETSSFFPLSAELLRVADALPPDADAAAAVLRLEVFARQNEAAAHATSANVNVNDGIAEPDALLERVHQSLPSLGIAAFLAERLARQKGDLESVLRWIDERRSYVNDPLEGSLDAVREAFLVADSDPRRASLRLEEAHALRPDDVALRDLFERISPEPLADCGTWRMAQAERRTHTNADSKAAWFLRAALEFDHVFDSQGALAAANAALEAYDRLASSPETPADSATSNAATLAQRVRDRAEIATGQSARLACMLIEKTAASEPLAVRIDAYERLAELEREEHVEHASEPARTSPALAQHHAILALAPRHLPSLRYVEHHAMGNSVAANTLEEVFEAVATQLDDPNGFEVPGHAEVAARLAHPSPENHESVARASRMAELAAAWPSPSLWSLRRTYGLARASGDASRVVTAAQRLLERVTRPAERAALLLRAAESSARLERIQETRDWLERAASEDPGDVVTWAFVAEVRAHMGDARGAAEACESLARASEVKAHQVHAWLDAANLWLEVVRDPERATAALEQCASIDVMHGDVFSKLSALYSAQHRDDELASLLAKRLEHIDENDHGARASFEVELARAFRALGDTYKAKAALARALGAQPDHTTALAALADVHLDDGDSNGAEQALVRLARLLTTPEEQREVYEKLGSLYLGQGVNLARAEVAYREVLKRAPGDTQALDKLVEVYTRQGDIAQALETKEQVIALTVDPAVRLERRIALARLHETSARDARKAEQILEAARKEFPASAVALQALAEFYERQKQMPAKHMILDRAAADVQRAFASGRFTAAAFELLRTAYELRGRPHHGGRVQASLEAFDTSRSRSSSKAVLVEKNLANVAHVALDPRFDDTLAPELLSSAVRSLFASFSDVLEGASPVHLEAFQVLPLDHGHPLCALALNVAARAGEAFGGTLRVVTSPHVDCEAVPVGGHGNTATLTIGEALCDAPSAGAFLVVRALKMLAAGVAPLFRAPTDESAFALVSALLFALDPNAKVNSEGDSPLSQRMAELLVRDRRYERDSNTSLAALEATATLRADRSALAAATFAAALRAWANRTALLATGDIHGALEALAWARGEKGVPESPAARAEWITRHAETRDLMAFSVSAAYAEAYAQVHASSTARDMRSRPPAR